jgi:hypothetical protein
VPRHSSHRPYQEKGRVATERDKFERVAWTVMVAEKIVTGRSASVGRPSVLLKSLKERAAHLVNYP